MTVIERININYSNYSKVQKRIADYIIKNTDKACFLSLKEISEVTEATEATIINFSKKIGYASFSELKKELQSYIQMVLSPSEKIVNAITDAKGIEGKLMEVIKQDSDELYRTMQGINLIDINNAVEMIYDAKKVYVVGEGISEIISDFLYMRMRLLGIDIRKLNMKTYNEISLQMLQVLPEDVFIFITFPRYAKKPMVIAEYLKEKGNRIISITDKNTSPIGIKSDVIFTCASDTYLFYNSITSSIALANLLVSALAFEMESTLLEKRDDRKKMLEYFYEKLEIQNGL